MIIDCHVHEENPVWWIEESLSRVGRGAGLSEPSCRSARCRQWNLRRP
jgi:hypothetical protein